MGTMLGAAFLLGAALGLLWGFLRPLGKRGDPLFVLMTGAGLCWLNFGFWSLLTCGLAVPQRCFPAFGPRIKAWVRCCSRCFMGFGLF